MSTKPMFRVKGEDDVSAKRRERLLLKAKDIEARRTKLMIEIGNLGQETNAIYTQIIQLNKRLK